MSLGLGEAEQKDKGCFRVWSTIPPVCYQAVCEDASLLKHALLSASGLKINLPRSSLVVQWEDATLPVQGARD